MANNEDLLGVEPDTEVPAKAPAKAKGKAKPADTATEIPAPLAAAIEENDTVLQAHFTRQANHEKDLAPSLAKRARDEAERDEQLRQHDEIDAKWRAHVAEQEKIQREREEREGAAERIAVLEAEIAGHEASIETKTLELKRLQKLVKE
jgi:chromosome segregation ATPase